ncbi:MAG: autotransporter domain-containing protein [Tepidisphaeraceae bacterium]
MSMLFLVSSACAGDYGGADFALRFPAALTRFAGYADVAACGNASAGSKWATSINPAATDWQPSEGKLKIDATPQFSLLDFDEGTQIYVASECLAWHSPGFGTFMPAAAQVWSNEATTALQYDFKFDADVYQLQWGIRPTEKWAFGLNFSYTDSHVKFLASDVPVAETDAESITGRAGLLHQFAKQWRLGVVVDYGQSRNDNSQLVMTPNGPKPVQGDTRTDQFSFRPGVCWEYVKDSSVYIDYQMLLLSDSEAGHLDLHRFSAGIDHELFKGIYVRVGAVVDTTGQFGWTCGGGISPAPWMSIDLAYQNDFFPELVPELGHSQTFTLSASLAF